MRYVDDINRTDKIDYSMFLGYDINLVVIEDCQDNHKYKNTNVLLNDGKISGWVVEP